MQITIYIYHTGAPDDPSKLTDTLVDRIEYGGQSIEFRDGKIRVETIEKLARKTMKCPHCGSDNITWTKFVCNECDEESD